MRMTEKTDSGNWCLRDVPWDQLKPGVLLTEKTWKKLYGALWKLKDYEDTGLSPEEVESVNDFEKSQTYRLIAELQEEREKHLWIPVTERLPENEDSVLISFDNIPIVANGYFAVYEDGNGAWYIEGSEVTCLSQGFIVTAWMPLPEMYKENENE